jgi:transcriptional regulator with XRE-family HTH domain
MDQVRIGQMVRALRRRLDWRQIDLAQRARLSQTMVSRVERGDLRGVPIEVIERVVNAVGGRLRVDILWRGEGAARLLDQAHSDLVERVVRLLEAAGWRTAIEVSFRIGREMGSIDVFAWHPARHAILVTEVKSVVPDEQQMHAALDRKTRLAPLIARERGWTASRVGRLLVVADSGTARRRVAAHAASFAAILPARGHAVRAWLRDPVEPRFAGLLFLPPTRRVLGKQRVRRVRRQVAP